jgi:uncharacterized protein RhaS with RHS repeats
MEIEVGSRSDRSAPTCETGPYAYDADGNLTRIGAVQYRYDKVSRLVSAASPVTNSTWANDAYGNMIAYGGRTFSGNVFGAYSVPLPIDAATNRLHDPNAVTPPDDVATYDGAGNMTQASYPSSTGGRFDYRYTWDALGAMRTLRAGDRSLLDAGADGLVKQRYLYTVDGERIGVLGTAPGGQPKSTWTLRGLDAALLSTFVEQSGSWSWKEDQIWRGTALLANESPTGTLHYHLDHLGSPRVVTNASGSLVGQQDFTPSAPAARRTAAPSSSPPTSATAFKPPPARTSKRSTTCTRAITRPRWAGS